jgi:hypothetical protein
LLRLCELTETLLTKVDIRELAFNPAVELSYLSFDEQTAVVDCMDKYVVKPSLSQAVRLKKMKQAGTLTLEVIDTILYRPAERLAKKAIGISKMKARALSQLGIRRGLLRCL